MLKRKYFFIAIILVVVIGGGILVWQYQQKPKITPKKATTENMVLIPAGVFLMGRENREGWSSMTAPEMFNDELPAHEVYVDAFYIDKYEVTNRQFKEFVDGTGYVTDAEREGASAVMVLADQADTPIQTGSGVITSTAPENTPIYTASIAKIIFIPQKF